jgi:hypothetical protein
MRGRQRAEDVLCVGEFGDLDCEGVKDGMLGRGEANPRRETNTAVSEGAVSPKSQQFESPRTNWTDQISPGRP